MYEFDSFGEDNEDICSLQGSFTRVRHVRKFNKIRVFCNFVCIQYLNHFRHSRTVTHDIVARHAWFHQVGEKNSWWFHMQNNVSNCILPVYDEIAYCQYTMARIQVNAADSNQNKDEETIKQICDNQIQRTVCSVRSIVVVHTFNDSL